MNNQAKPLTRKEAAVRWAMFGKVYARYNGVNLPIRPMPGDPPLPHTEHESFSCRILEDPDATFHCYPEDEIFQAAEKTTDRLTQSSKWPEYINTNHPVYTDNQNKP